MSSPPRPLTSSPFAESSGYPSSPLTPSPSLRSRNVTLVDKESPTTTLSESAGSIRLSNIPRTTFRNVFPASVAAPRSRVVVRSDPSLLTCFDPLDKELYDLWVPKE